MYVFLVRKRGISPFNETEEALTCILVRKDTNSTRQALNFDEKTKSCQFNETSPNMHFGEKTCQFNETSLHLGEKTEDMPTQRKRTSPLHLV
ncbi:hypothetical protein TNCV_4980561 [Trichonephila clavipes]|nr:hypothetical protein TNCV_4980561 [Trichonephila clavipes]